MHPAVKCYIQRRLTGDSHYYAATYSLWECDENWYFAESLPRSLDRWEQTMTERLVELGLPEGALGDSEETT